MRREDSSRSAGGRSPPHRSGGGGAGRQIADGRCSWGWIGYSWLRGHASLRPTNGTRTVRPLRPRRGHTRKEIFKKKNLRRKISGGGGEGWLVSWVGSWTRSPVRSGPRARPLAFFPNGCNPGPLRRNMFFSMELGSSIPS